ncbi:MAG: ATP-binding cassette domain-containing protein [Ignisphaera sp.]|nr:ATP-binding cassette domain-containing protein [Ignisphaera sp.]MDW8085962.1 ATP-binding cassette domain-containing protein [Ignisphaera sp.]
MREQLVVEAANITVYANGRRILHDVGFTLRNGEKLLVTGRSGSGKTTLLRSLTGIASELYGLSVHGRVIVGGEKIRSAADASRYVCYVPQEPWYSIVPPYPVLTVDLKSVGRGYSDAVELARLLNIEHKLYDSSTNLSGGEAQRIALLEAFLSNRKLVLIDEASSYLDRESKVKLVEAVRSLSECGVAFVIVDHDIVLWRDSVDAVLYMDRGSSRIFEDVSETPIYEDLSTLEMASKDLEPMQVKGDVVLEASDIWFRYPDSDTYIVKGFGMNMRKGEIVWLRGRSGSGKTTILKILSRILRPSRGLLKYTGGVRTAQLIPENPLHYITNPTVGEEMMGSTDLARELDLEKTWDTPITLLSSGEKRRLALASAYLRSPELLLVDEPTIGLDPWNAVKVLNLLRNLSLKGCSLVIASHGDEVGLISHKALSI